MRAAAVPLLVAVLAGAGGVSAQAPNPHPSEPSIALPGDLARVLTDYEGAWRARDPGALAALFAEDGFVLPNGRPPVRGRDAIAKHYAGSGGPLALRAIAYGRDGATAYIIGGYASARGAPDAGKFTLTLRQADERWLIVSDMDSPNTRPGGAGGGPPSDAIAVLHTSAEDWNRGNLDGFVAPYHERAMFMTSTGPIDRAATRDRYQKKYFAGGKPDQQLRFEQLHVVPLAADTAVMTGRFVLTGGGRPDQSGWFTLIWVRTPQGWKIIHDHTS